MLRTFLIFTIAIISHAWIRFRLPGDYSDDDYLDSRERLFRPMFGETLLERILRARERLHVIESLEENRTSAHAEDPLELAIPLDDPLPIRSFGLADVVEMLFMAIVILSMISAAYIIKSRSDELAASKRLALPQTCTKLNKASYGIIDQSVNPRREESV